MPIAYSTPDLLVGWLDLIQPGLYASLSGFKTRRLNEAPQKTTIEISLNGLCGCTMQQEIWANAHETLESL